MNPGDLTVTDGQLRLTALWSLYLSLDSVLSSDSGAASSTRAAPSLPTGDRPSGRSPARGAGTASRKKARKSAARRRKLGLDGHTGRRHELDPRVREAIGELADLLRRQVRGRRRTVGDGAQVRRIAELLEVLELDHVAVHWWARAAQLGDRDAADYLEILKEDRDIPEPPALCANGKRCEPDGLPEPPSDSELLLCKRELDCWEVVQQGSAYLSCIPAWDAKWPINLAPRHFALSQERFWLAKVAIDGLVLSGRMSMEPDGAETCDEDLAAEAKELIREIEEHLADLDSLAIAACGEVPRDA
jgi:hypothetical protein